MSNDENMNVSAPQPPSGPQLAPTNTPKDFECPISQTLMSDPVLCADGFSYERVEIAKWLEHNNTSPMTGEHLQNKSLIANNTLRAAIRAYLDENRAQRQASAMAASLSAGFSPVSSSYVYDDQDITEILLCRLGQSKRAGQYDSSPSSSKPIFILAAIDAASPSQLAERLQLDNYCRGGHVNATSNNQIVEAAETKQKSGARILLIPCRVGATHWSALFVEFDENGYFEHADYVDSLVTTKHLVNTSSGIGVNMRAKLQHQLESVHPGASLESRSLLRQKPEEEALGAGGPYVIENLLLLVQNKARADRQVTADAIRLIHIECVAELNPTYYQMLRIKQNEHMSASLSPTNVNKSARNKVACQSLMAAESELTATPSHLLASVSADRTVRLWDLERGRCWQTLTDYDVPTVEWMEMVSSEQLTVMFKNNSIHVRNIRSSTTAGDLQLIGHTAQVYAVTLVGENRLASASKDKSIKIWELSSATVAGCGDCAMTMHGHADAVVSLRLVARDRLASGSCDNKVKIWSMTNGECLRTLSGHLGWVSAIEALSRHRLASASYDKKIRIWEWSNRGTCLLMLSGHTEPVLALKALPHGYLASGAKDNTVRVWSLDTGDCMRSFVDHTGWVRALEVVAPNRIASASDDKTVRVWTLGDGECVRTLVGHTDHVDSLALVSSPSVGWSCTIS